MRASQGTRRVLVTGASTGLGLAAARALRSQGCAVVVHVRDGSRVPGTGGASSWHGVVLGDLSDLQQVRGVAEQVVEQVAAHGCFDAVVHNAGTLHGPAAGVVNVVAPFLLTALTPPAGRLVHLSSSMHRAGSTDVRRLAAGTATYEDSKLWVTALSMVLARRWAGTGSHAVDPGWVPTRMGGPGAPDDLVAGHQTQVWLAGTEQVSPATGGYWHHRRTRSPLPVVHDDSFQQALLEALEEFTGVRLPAPDVHGGPGAPYPG